MVDMRMELLAPYGELRPEHDPPRVRKPWLLYTCTLLDCCQKHC